MKNVAQLARIQVVPQAVWHWYKDAGTKTQVPAIGAMFITATATNDVKFVCRAYFTPRDK